MGHHGGALVLVKCGRMIPRPFLTVLRGPIGMSYHIIFRTYLLTTPH